MLAIVDSGGTKADWIFLDQQGQIVHSLTTVGMNPLISNNFDLVEQRLSSILTSEEFSSVEELKFYGAGCSDTKVARKLKKDFKKRLFHTARIRINTDLQGAALACLGEDQGLIGIIGTGSSAAYYDGQQIKEKSPALGYLINDEGSGYYLGRHILLDYLYSRLPEEIKIRFSQKYKEQLKNLTDYLYKGERPNSRIAKFSEILVEFNSDPYAEKIIMDGFNLFFERQVLALKNISEKQISFVGSIAYYYEGHLKESAKQFGFEVKKTIDKPIMHLARLERKSLQSKKPPVKTRGFKK